MVNLNNYFIFFFSKKKKKQNIYRKISSFASVSSELHASVDLSERFAAKKITGLKMKLCLGKGERIVTQTHEGLRWRFFSSARVTFTGLGFP